MADARARAVVSLPVPLLWKSPAVCGRCWPMMESARRISVVETSEGELRILGAALPLPLRGDDGSTSPLSLRPRVAEDVELHVERRIFLGLDAPPRCRARVQHDVVDEEVGRAGFDAVEDLLR